jgi:hypothetical protein
MHDPTIDLATGNRDSRISDILNEVKLWEKMPDRREPLTVDMISYQKLLTHESKPHSEDAAMYDWEVFGIYAGNRLTEWAQRNGTDIINNIDGLPKAFLISDLEFFGANRRQMTRTDALRRPYLVHTANVTWRFQKNRENGEKKPLYEPLVIQPFAPFRLSFE